MLVKKAYLAPELVAVALDGTDVVTASVASVQFNSNAWGTNWDGWNVED